MKDQKSHAERLLLEKAESIRVQESEIAKREEKLRRWEREMQRLESKAVQESEKSNTIQGEVERMRSMRVDDALAIERLRVAIGEVQGALNEVVGVFSAFSHHLGGEKDVMVEGLREAIDKLRPVKNAEEVTMGMREVRHCISNLIVYAKSIAEKAKDQGREKRIENSPP